MSTAKTQRHLPIERVQQIALIVAVVGVVFCGTGWIVNTSQFYQSYLFSFMYWRALGLGCLGLALVHHLTGGKWGYVARPFLDAGIMTLPLLALAFLPIIFGIWDLYPWSQPEYFAGQEHAANRAWYLQPWFFIVRSLLYFTILSSLGWLLTRNTRPENGKVARYRLPVLGGMGAVVAANVVSFEAVDWTMTLQTHYYSTMYGALFVGGALVCGMALVTASVALTLRTTEPSSRESGITVMHDLGKLLLAMLMVWAYLAFSNFMIAYAGDLPHEASWYLDRTKGGWSFVGVLLILLHFAIPFAVLLSRSLKRNPLLLALVATALLAIHILDLFWLIAPAFHPREFHLHWLDLAVPITLGGIWLAMFCQGLRYRLVPVLPNWPQEVTSHG